MKLKTLIEIVQGISGIAQDRLPVQTAYRLGLFVKQSETLISQYDDNRKNLIERYGEKQDNGDISVKDPEKLKSFTKELETLLEMEVTPPTFEPRLTLENFGDCKLPIAFFASITDLISP